MLGNKTVNVSRDVLIQICERAIVQESEWANRDSPESQRQVGECWALLQAGCAFFVTIEDPGGETYWVHISHKTFSTFEFGSGYEDTNTYYLPTLERLENAGDGDWY